jgi:acyl-CoA synthetase (AMP-forming)/AMP-acid ligase II
MVDVPFFDRISAVGGLLATVVRAGVIAPLRPDKYVRIIAAAQRDGLSVTSGFAMSAQRSPDRAALVDELGTLTYREIDERADALAVGFQALPGGAGTIGIMCRNHRGFVESLIAANRVGADVLLLNTSFAGPALAEVVEREGVDVVIYDEEYTETVDTALAGKTGSSSHGPPSPSSLGLVDRSATARILGWVDGDHAGVPTVQSLIDTHRGQRPEKPSGKGKLILLTSGTTGTPKGAARTGGGANELKAILERVPWRTDKTIVVVAPMFHAWGFSQLVFAASMACTVVTRRRFDPETTLALIDEHQAYGLCVVPVMFDRIIDLPDDVRTKYSGRSLRFATASGSRMRPDVVVKFMDQFGDIIYNNYNATEAGMIATATPQDLRAAPDTAGRPVAGTEIRILDDTFAEVPTGEVGQIFVRNTSQFDGYTSGSTKDFHEDFMASGDLGRLDADGRLFVVGRDDEMIVSGGENVYPIEVEKTLMNHAAVTEASVIGVDDETYGQRLVAFVVLADGAAASTDDLKQHVRDNLANYKVPREITVLDEMPRNNTGKVLRRELQALAEPEAGRGQA